MKKTKKQYVEYLNEIGFSISPDNFIMKGKQRFGLYGYLLRKYDPIAFEIGFKEWREKYE